MTGSWNVDVAVGKMPQKVASAFTSFNEKIVGAEYTPIAYLGSQIVNGTNHAVLAEQLVVNGKDTKNVVVLIFNEAIKSDEITLINIERVVESGGEFGGVTVDVKTDIPEEAKSVFDTTIESFVGSNVAPFALLGTQIANGTNYIFAAEITSVTRDPEKKVGIVVVNSNHDNIAFTDLLSASTQKALEYAFTW